MSPLIHDSRYYHIPLEHLLPVAGIQDEIPRTADRISPLDIQRAFNFVLTDPHVVHYQQPAETLSLDLQEYLVQIYEHYAGRKLL